jgi:hypothetical protein
MKAREKTRPPEKARPRIDWNLIREAQRQMREYEAAMREMGLEPGGRPSYNLASPWESRLRPVDD